MNIQAYCVKCKAPREILDPRKVGMKNGRFAAKGPCSVCGTTMFKILSKECVEALVNLSAEAAASGPGDTHEKPE